MADLRDETRQVVEDLEERLRLLAAFGIRQVAAPQEAPPVALAATAVSEERAGGYRFGESRKAKFDQAARAVVEPRASEPEAPRRAQGGLFGPRGQTEAAAPAPAAPSWQPNPLSPTEAQAKLDGLCQEIGDCTRCKLSERRTKIVFGEGNPVAKIVFAGEGPGQEEDRTGRPFVGRAGQLLDKIIQAMGYKREDVYICNVVKCRPPDNRTPQDDEMRTCGLFLTRQLEIIRPRHIVALGATAAKYLLGTNSAMNRIRGRFFEHPSGARLMPTFHPAYLLRNPAAKKDVWEDVQKVMAGAKEQSS